MRWFPKKQSAETATDQTSRTIEEAPSAEAEGWTAGRQLSTTLIGVGLWAVVACGPLALAGQLFAPSSTAVAAAPVSVTPGLTSGEQAAGAHAEAFVAAWLRATRHDSADLAQFISIPAGSVTAEQPLAYRDLGVVAIEPGEHGLVAVTVSVAVADAHREEKDASVQVWHQRYYQVLVSVSGTELAVMGLPMQVSGPAAAQLPKVEYVQFSATSSAGETVRLFLSAYLCASGDLNRTLSPGAAILAVDPAPYFSVRPTKLLGSTKPKEQPSSGDVIHVQVEVEAILANEHTVSMTYWLTLTARDGRWEVRSLDPGPSADSLRFEGSSSSAHPDEDPVPSTQTPAPSDSKP